MKTRQTASLLVLLALLTGCEPKASMSPNVETPNPSKSDSNPATVRSLEYTSTNGSIPPKYQKVVRITLDGSGFEEHRAAADAIIDKVRVNDMVTLREYIQMHSVGDTAGISNVRAKNADQLVPSGAETTTLTFHMSDGKAFSIEQYQESYSNLGPLYTLVAEEGEKTVRSADEPAALPSEGPPE